MVSLQKQIENVWNTSKYTKPSVILITGQDHDYYIVISETSSTYRTLDRNGHVITVSKLQNISSGQSNNNTNANIEMIATECRFPGELDNFVTEEIHPLVFIQDGY